MGTVNAVAEKDAALLECVTILSDVLTHAIPGDRDGSEKGWWERFAVEIRAARDKAQAALLIDKEGG